MDDVGNQTAWRLADRLATAEDQRNELRLRLADIAAVLRAVEYDDEGEPTNADGSLLSALDYALRGSPGCIEPVEWQARRRAALAQHGDYAGLSEKQR